MEPLFPSDLVSGSVTDQARLDAAFLQYPHHSRAFITTALAKPEVRKWYEDRWPRLQEYLDRDFGVKFQMESEHNARAWEFHLGAVLLERGLILEKKTFEVGPDFCIKISGTQKIWIEAIACDLGEVDPVPPMPEMIPGIMYPSGGNIEDDNRPKVLRITSAIGTKLEKYKHYLQDSQSGVSENDCFIVAINGAKIEFVSNSNTLLKRAVFGQGPDVYVRKKGKEKFKGPFYQSISTVIKKAITGDETIPANLMEIDEFSKISAVIYSGNSIYNSWLNGYKPGDDFIFAYHSNPNNPIPDRLFKFGRSARKNVESGVIEDKQQS